MAISKDHKQQVKDTAERAMIFMLTGKTPAQLAEIDINNFIKKAFEISKAFHAFDPEAKK